MEEKSRREPEGFGEHTRKTPGENAHEQGWGLNEDERQRESRNSVPEGGTDYDYGARDFGDSPVNTAREQTPQKEENPGRRPPGSENSEGEKDQRTSTSRG